MTSSFLNSKKTPSIRVLDGYVVQDILTKGKQVVGVVARDQAGTGSNKIRLQARAVVMAAGGIGHHGGNCPSDDGPAVWEIVGCGRLRCRLLRVRRRASRNGDCSSTRSGGTESNR